MISYSFQISDIRPVVQAAALERVMISRVRFEVRKKMAVLP